MTQPAMRPGDGEGDFEEDAAAGVEDCVVSDVVGPAVDWRFVGEGDGEAALLCALDEETGVSDGVATALGRCMLGIAVGISTAV